MASEAARLEGLLTACLSFDNAVRPGRQQPPAWPVGPALPPLAAAAAAAARANHLPPPLAACQQQVRKQAEDAVKQLSNRPDVIPALLQLLQCAADAQVRQLAAVLARKWVVRHWSKLPAEVSRLLQLLAVAVDAAAAGNRASSEQQ